MKKIFVLLILIFLAGCATLGIKPTESEINQLENNLLVADLGETAVFIVFDTLCSEKVLNVDQCAIGYAADAEWDGAYVLATSAIGDYRAGKSDAEMVKKYIGEATKTVARVIKKIKELSGEKPATKAARNKVLTLKPK